MTDSFLKGAIWLSFCKLSEVDQVVVADKFSRKSRNAIQIASMRPTGKAARRRRRRQRDRLASSAMRVVVAAGGFDGIHDSSSIYDNIDNKEDFEITRFLEEDPGDSEASDVSIGSYHRE